MAFTAASDEPLWYEMFDKTFAAEALERYKAGDYADSEWTYVRRSPSCADFLELAGDADHLPSRRS